MKARITLILALSCFTLSIGAARLVGQETETFGTRQGVSTWFGFAPTSQHILIGTAQNRETFQAALGYTYKIKRWSDLSISYEGSIQPIYFERDPTFIGTSKPNQTGPPTITTFLQPYRPIGLYGDFGYVYIGNGQSVAIAGVPGPRENTYAFAALPLGVRVAVFTRGRFQPTFSIDLGALYAARNIPVDYSSSFNFLASLGPGLEVYLTQKRSVRLEYLYEHLSNAGLGSQNPGLDSGGYRLTFTQYR
jgi:hypothetical protein